MRRTEQVQGLRLMKFEEVYGRSHRGGLSQPEAAEVLGVSERTFRRWRDRYEAEGADGLYDRRLGRVSAHSVRAALTGLRKKDHDIRREKSEKGVTVYKTAER